MKNEHLFRKSLVILLAVGSAIGPSPACSAAALLVCFAYTIAEKYFHDSYHDENKATIAQLKADYAKMKTKQDQIDARLAFGSVKNG